MAAPSSGSGAGESSPSPVIAPARSEDPAWLHGSKLLLFVFLVNVVVPQVVNAIGVFLRASSLRKEADLNNQG